MMTLKKVTLAAALTTLFAASPLLANETYLCTHDTQERRINILYANEGAAVPCEVTYDKGEGATTSLWQAQNLAGYCEEKAVAFVEQQRGWGWTCNKQ